VVERIIFGILAVLLILDPFGDTGQFITLGLFAAALAWCMRSSIFGTGKPVVAEP